MPDPPPPLVCYAQGHNFFRGRGKNILPLIKIFLTAPLKCNMPLVPPGLTRLCVCAFVIAKTALHNNFNHMIPFKLFC